MTQRYVFVLAGLIVLAAVSLFNIKYAVVAAEGEIARMEQQIEAERWLLRTLEADWAHLARAERLAAQAQALNMAPATLTRFVRAEQIGDYRHLRLAREARALELPSGQTIRVRVKPVAPQLLDALAHPTDALGPEW